MPDRRTTLRRTIYLAMMFAALLLPLAADAPVEAYYDCDMYCVDAWWEGPAMRCTQYRSYGCLVCTMKCPI